MKIEDIYKTKLLWKYVISEDNALREIALLKSPCQPDYFIIIQTRGDVFEGEDLDVMQMSLPRDVVLMLIDALQKATDPKSKSVFEPLLGIENLLKIKLLWRKVISEDGILREISLSKSLHYEDCFEITQTKEDGEYLDIKYIALPLDLAIKLISALQQATDPNSNPDNSEGPPA